MNDKWLRKAEEFMGKKEKRLNDDCPNEEWYKNGFNECYDKLKPIVATLLETMAFDQKYEDQLRLYVDELQAALDRIEKAISIEKLAETIWNDNPVYDISWEELKKKDAPLTLIIERMDTAIHTKITQAKEGKEEQ